MQKLISNDSQVQKCHINHADLYLIMLDMHNHAFFSTARSI